MWLFTDFHLQSAAREIQSSAREIQSSVRMIQSVSGKTDYAIKSSAREIQSSVSEAVLMTKFWKKSYYIVAIQNISYKFAMNIS